MDSGPPPPPTYPQIDPRLQQLDGSALQFWGAPAVRERALWAILDAFAQRDDQRLRAALQVVDDAVAAGMRALGFPRGPINDLRLRRISALGRKRPTCELEIDILALRHAMTIAGHPDSVVETWVHESAHARVTPWAANYRAEMVTWKGYEEGLAEGCAKVVGRLGALTDGSHAYPRYQCGYDHLSEALGVTHEDLYRRFWSERTGLVRQAFTDVVNDLYHQRRGRGLTLEGRRDVQDLADEIFASSQENVSDRAVEQWIEQEWRRRLP